MAVSSTPINDLDKCLPVMLENARQQREWDRRKPMSLKQRIKGILENHHVGALCPLGQGLGLSSYDADQLREQIMQAIKEDNKCCHLHVTEDIALVGED